MQARNMLLAELDFSIERMKMVPLATPTVQNGIVTLQLSCWNRPIVYIVDYYEKCIPSAAIEGIRNRIVLSSREEAIKWAKKQFELTFGFDWSSWKQDPEKYPNYKNCDNLNWDPTFIATVGNWPDEPLRTVRVQQTEICQIF